MGLEKLNKKFDDEDNKEYFEGLFPVDHPKNTRFAINFYTSCGVNSDFFIFFGDFSKWFFVF